MFQEIKIEQIEADVVKFVQALNVEYTKRGVNAVAHLVRKSIVEWNVFVDTDCGKESYSVWWDGKGFDFIRVVT